MTTVFQKMHGAGNDFVLLDLREQHFRIDPETARRLADRHTGIGCDQVLVLRPPADPACLADFEVWNADGSPAEQCGNGVRCIGLYLAGRNGPAGGFTIGGPVAPIHLTMQADGQVQVDMGTPEFAPERIPVNGQPEAGFYRLQAGTDHLRVGAVSMGNPHCVLSVGSVDAPEIDRLGPLISRHEMFPQGCNAGFAEIIDRSRIRLRVFERGAGETQACGSGACAAVAVLRQAGLLGQKVQVLQEGGTLAIEWPGNFAHLMMTGPAVHVYEGTLK
jgi:diaminopimelate epimerase